MKINEPQAAVHPTQSDVMDDKSFTSNNRQTGLIDVCMDTARKEIGVPQGASNQSSVGTQSRRSSDRSVASTMVDFDVTVMQPFYRHFERSMEPMASRGMTLGGDSSGDDTYSAEMLSPSYGFSDVTSLAHWTCRPDPCGNAGQRDRHVVAPRSDARGYDLTQKGEIAPGNKASRRFLSSETIRSASDCRRKDKVHSRQYGGSDNFSVDAEFEKCDYRSSGCDVNIASSSFDNSFEQIDAPSSNVMREIDLAVSMAHSRFKDMEPRSSSDEASRHAQDHASPQFMSCEVGGAQSNRMSRTSTVELQPNPQADGRPPVTKDYASHNMSARPAEDEWKRKSDYGGADPAAHGLRTTFEQSRVREMGSIARRSIERGKSYSAAGCDRNCSTIEEVPLESAASAEPSTLPFQTKINSNHDERNTASYAVGASLLHLQSSTREAYWPQMRTFDKQVLDRSSGKNAAGAYAEGLSISEVDNKPINLCLQQGKVRESGLGLDVPTFKLDKEPEFRKCARSFSAREKPYHIPKRRTRSQCSGSPATTNALPSTDPGYIGARAGSGNRQANVRDMGIDNRTALESYTKESKPFLGQDSAADGNTANLFSLNEASHMMVQDESKTYAILSDRRNEDLMNPHALSSSVSPLQQQSMYHQARHSHSIINYVGPHGQSPDMRTSEMSPSPPVRSHRATPSSSLPGIMSSGKVFPNVIVAPRQHQHSVSPSQQDDYRGQDLFQRHYESPTTHYDSGLQDSRHHLQHHHYVGHHQNTSTFSPLHVATQQHHHHQQPQPPQYVLKPQKKEYYNNLPSYSGLGSSSAIPYAGSLQVSQHHGYLKPPPVDLDDLSEEERERMRVKRERNRVAAAKCRNRRRELLERLEKEAEQLEREQELLRENVRRLRVQKLQLGNILEDHEPTCQTNISEETTTKSPEFQDAIMTKDDQPNGAPAGGLGNNESSPSKNTTSPVQIRQIQA